MAVTEENGDRDAAKPMQMQRSLRVKFVTLHQSQFFRGVNHQFLCTHLTPTEIY